MGLRPIPRKPFEKGLSENFKVSSERNEFIVINTGKKGLDRGYSGGKPRKVDLFVSFEKFVDE